MRKCVYAILLLGLTGCMSGGPETEYHEDAPVFSGGAAGVDFSAPSGNDLRLETDHHIVHVTADSNVPYAYYVWTGDKTYDDDPDIIIENGDTYVLTNE